MRSPIVDGYGLEWLSYEAYRTSEWWEDRVALFHGWFNGICADCQERPIEDLHHLHYWRGGETVLGREDIGDCVPLCRRCHMNRHNNWGMGA